MDVRHMIQEAALVVIDGTGYRVLYCEDDYFLAQDEDRGDEVRIPYEDIDLARDCIYKLTLMNP